MYEYMYGHIHVVTPPNHPLARSGEDDQHFLPHIFTAGKEDTPEKVHQD